MRPDSARGAAISYIAHLGPVDPQKSRRRRRIAGLLGGVGVVALLTISLFLYLVFRPVGFEEWKAAHVAEGQAGLAAYVRCQPKLPEPLPGRKVPSSAELQGLWEAWTELELPERDYLFWSGRPWDVRASTVRVADHPCRFRADGVVEPGEKMVEAARRMARARLAASVARSGMVGAEVPPIAPSPELTLLLDACERVLLENPSVALADPVGGESQYAEVQFFVKLYPLAVLRAWERGEADRACRLLESFARVSATKVLRQYDQPMGFWRGRPVVPGLAQLVSDLGSDPSFPEAGLQRVDEILRLARLTPEEGRKLDRALIINTEGVLTDETRGGLPLGRARTASGRHVYPILKRWYINQVDRVALALGEGDRGAAVRAGRRLDAPQTRLLMNYVGEPVSQMFHRELPAEASDEANRLGNPEWGVLIQPHIDMGVWWSRISEAGENTRWVLAVARYRRAHGCDPKRWEDLVPEYMDLESARWRGAGVAVVEIPAFNQTSFGSLLPPFARPAARAFSHYRRLHGEDPSVPEEIEGLMTDKGWYDAEVGPRVDVPTRTIQAIFRPLDAGDPEAWLQFLELCGDRNPQPGDAADVAAFAAGDAKYVSVTVLLPPVMNGGHGAGDWCWLAEAPACP